MKPTEHCPCTRCEFFDLYTMNYCKKHKINTSEDKTCGDWKLYPEIIKVEKVSQKMKLELE